MIETGPDVEAFIAGVQLVLAVGFIVVVGLVGVSIIRRILGA